MVLNDSLIHRYCIEGMVKPYEPKMVNPASLDLRWSGKYRLATPAGWGGVTEVDELKLQPGDFVLVDTLEYVTMPLNLCGNLMLKSSRGREGLEHLHAGFFDPGFSGTATLELINVAPWPVVIKKGQPIVQLVFMECYPPAVGYDKTGRYNGQAEPQPAK